MTAPDWLQLFLILGAVALLTKPLGIYLLRVLDPEREGGTPLDRWLGPLERVVYRILRVRPDRGQTWMQYTISCLTFSALTTLVTYALLRLQDRLPLNPQHLPALSPHLAFNTAVSFVTNTNWQSYGGEATMSYLSQMVALVMHHFFSAAVGIAIAAALVRGIAVSQGKTIGNFWRDMTRLILYLLLPMALVYAVFLVWDGDPQNFRPYTVVSGARPVRRRRGQAGAADDRPGSDRLDDLDQDARHQRRRLHERQLRAPVREPDAALGNFVQMVLFISLASALTYYLGRMVATRSTAGRSSARCSWCCWAASSSCWYAEKRRQSARPRAGRGVRARQHGGQGGPLRRLQLGRLRRHDHEHHLRRRQHHARQLHAARRPGSARQHAAGRGHLRRRRDRASTGCWSSSSWRSSSPA